ncbi:PREDICTED: nucleolin-like [Camelina sativa]|uniref:Nucleolin-like n=1 Tax=Camelina sativa TaxID=90675 RepID=A0ABM0Y339_CAMSA|nr:PREDICTED: nucleolin-like [Camelina sativa]
MADVENQQDSSFPVKRKSDLFCQNQDNLSNKSQKLNPESKDGGENNESGIEDLDSTGAESSVCPERLAEKVNNGVIGDLLGAEEEQQVGDEEDEEEDDEEEDEEEVEEVVDRKGKGISREDKGKGKLIEVDSSDDEEDDSDDDDEGFGEDDESDFSDDPLAEVDLDNILPSRTRRRSSQPGVYISNDVSNRGEDDDSSDDSDA